jgi:hypothetical protein
MDDAIKKMIDKGWIEMSMTLDEQMPVARVTHMGRYRHYYSAAMVLILIFTSFILMNDSSLIINYYHLANADNSIENGAEKELKTNFRQENITETVVVSVVEESISDHLYADEIIKKNTNSRHTATISPIPAKYFIAHKSNEINPLNSFTQRIENRNKDLNIVTEVGGSKIAFNYDDNFRHNTFSVMVNSINEDFASLGGVDGGFNYAYRLNKNIGFMTGIEHSLLAMAMNDPDMPDMRRSDAMFRSYDENNRLYPEGTTTENSELFYYVGIPVGVLYSISDFTISAGMKFSYLVNTPGMLSGNINPEFADIIAENDLSTDFSNLAYNRFDYSFILGFEFQIFKDFSLISRLNYSHSNLVNSYSYGENEIGNVFMVSGLENNIRDRIGRNMYFGIGIKYDLARR